jgi:hypothetical protein
MECLQNDNRDGAEEAIAEVLTLVPHDDAPCAPGIMSPVREIRARGVLNHCSVDRTADMSPEQLAVTFARASLPWDLRCGDEIRRSGDEATYEIIAVLSEGASLVTAVASPVPAGGWLSSR